MFSQSQSVLLGNQNSFVTTPIEPEPYGFLPQILNESLQPVSRFDTSLLGVAAVSEGTLDSTDPTNPTRFGTFRDDYLLTNVTVGQQVQLNLNASFDTYLQVVNGDTGQLLFSDDDSGDGLNSQLNFTVQDSIRYVVRATSYSQNTTGDYSLSSDVGNLTAGFALGTDESVSGSLVTSDPANELRSGRFYDGYLLTNLTAGQLVQVSLNSSDFDAYLQVVNADTGEVVAFNDDSNNTLNSQLSFTVEDDINYIVRATTYGSAQTGEYTLTTRGASILSGTLDSTDPTNPTRTGRLSDDYYLSNLVVGEQVQVNMNAAFDTYLQLVNADTGAVIAFDDDSGEGLNSQLSFTVQDSIRYLLRATTYSTNVTGDYTLNTFSGTPTSGTALGTNQTFNGSLVTTDPGNELRSGRFYDGYLLTNLVAGQQVQVNMNAEFDTYLQLVNADTGEIIAFDDDSGEGLNSQLSFTVEKDIDYIVRATTYGSAQTGNYTLTTRGSSILSGTLDSTDPTNPTRTGRLSDDYYLSDLVVGEQVQVNMNAAFDTYLQLVNADTGAVIAFDDDSGEGLNSQLSFTVQDSIRYLLRATSYSTNVTGDYNLSTIFGTPTSGTALGANQTFNGSLVTSDPGNELRSGSLYDGYLLTNLTAGQQVQLNMNAEFDTYLQLVNADTGEIVAFDDDSGEGLNSQLSFTVESDINYLVRATSFSADATGSYTLITTSSSTTPVPGTISGNDTLDGALETTDSDNPTRSGHFSDDYQLTGVATGQVVQVNLTSAAFDTYLQLIDAETGEVLSFNDDSGSSLNSQLVFTVEADQSYLIRVTSYSSAATGNYTLATNTVTVPDGFSPNFGYGLVDAAAAVANALGVDPFEDVPDVGGNNWGNELINAPEVWAQGITGEGIVVAVIDTGVDYNHVDLDANIWVNTNEIAGNGIDDDGNGYVDDIRGWDFVDDDSDPMDLNDHGTHVAGTIAAENNGIGVTGVAYNAQIMAVRVLNASGSGTYGDVAAGVRYAADNGANVINLSLGGGYSSELEDAIEYAAGLGCVVVMASGNESSSQPGFPASVADEWGIAVGAVDSTKTLAYFSNDAGVTPLDYVVAPGVDVLSTTPGDNYESFSGTSMATPHVAGVAALILSANSQLTAAEVEDIITETANPEGITV